jgi:thiamine biosynthesis lipoprotein
MTHRTKTMQHIENGSAPVTTGVTRRRFIAIVAAAAGLKTFPAGAAPTPARWHGVALGAKAGLTLYHPDPAVARDGIETAVAEVRRLEKIFSLYRSDSSLSKLNVTGMLATPPLDLVRCLDDGRRISELTDGAFDVTVQPLWQLFSQHFSAPDADPRGPDEDTIAAIRDLVDFSRVTISANRISLRRPGMAVTLNGIAQGYITDRVTDLLRARGFNNILVDLGETRAMGTHANGTPWRVGIRDPFQGDHLAVKLPLKDRAVATSGGYGMWFDTAKRHHHLFDPRTGRSTDRWQSITVVAGDATTADALSTAFSAMPREAISRIAEQSQVRVLALGAKETKIRSFG